MMIVRTLADKCKLLALQRYAAWKEVKKDEGNDRNSDPNAVHLAQPGQTVRPVK